MSDVWLAPLQGELWLCTGLRADEGSPTNRTPDVSHERDAAELSLLTAGNGPRACEHMQISKKLNQLKIAVTTPDT